MQSGLENDYRVTKTQVTLDRQGIPRSLPGFQYRDFKQTNFHKKQTFNISHGSMGEHAINEDYDDEMLSTLQKHTTKEMVDLSDKKTAINPSIPRVSPTWLKFDRIVLRFYAYFLEPVVESFEENMRIRKIIIHHHLDDGTTQLTEPKIENSGIPQGILLKKHKIPKPDGEQQTQEDLSVGSTISIYSRSQRIIDADEKTREFYKNIGLTLSEAETYPGNQFEKVRSMKEQREAPHDTMELKEYLEVKLAGGHPNKNLKNYISNDRKVLSYNVAWNDPGFDGGIKKYILNYFLSDKTIEIKEILVPNSGKDAFHLLLKRSKLAKEPIKTHFPGMSLRKEDYQTDDDLILGNTICAWNRELFLYDCDEFTKQWVRDNKGIELQPIKLPEPIHQQPVSSIPEHTGFGSEEDSLTSVVSLKKQAPKKDEIKSFNMDKYILRFEAKLQSEEPDNATRLFLLAFYCGDDSISVWEKVGKNDGIIGGKFMERKKHKNPKTHTFQNEKDFQLGSLIVLNKFKFILYTADEFTLKQMESEPEIFPQACINKVLNKVRQTGGGDVDTKAFSEKLFSFLDENKDDKITFTEFFKGLEKLGIRLTNQEQQTVFRHFDKDHNRVIDKEEIYNALVVLE